MADIIPAILSESEAEELGAITIPHMKGEYIVNAYKIVEMVKNDRIHAYAHNRGGKPLSRPLINKIKGNFQPAILGKATLARNGQGYDLSDFHHRLKAIAELHEEGKLSRELYITAVFVEKKSHTNAYTGVNEHLGHTAANKYKNPDLYYGSQLARVAGLMYPDTEPKKAPAQFWRLSNNLAYFVDVFRNKSDFKGATYYSVFKVRKGTTKKFSNTAASEMRYAYLSEAQLYKIAEAALWWFNIEQKNEHVDDTTTRGIMKSKSFAGLMMLQKLKGSAVGRLTPEEAAHRIRARNASIHDFGGVSLTGGSQERSEAAEMKILTELEKRLPPYYHKN